VSHLSLVISQNGLSSCPFSLEVFSSAQNQKLSDDGNSSLIDSHVALKNQNGCIKRSNNLLIALTGSPYFKGMPLSIEQVADKILNEFEAKGTETHAQIFAQILGTFSLAVISLDSFNCYLASDRTGVNRLFWHSNNKGDFAFSSSLKELALLCNKQNNISAQSLYNYMYFHMIPTPLCIYEDINKLKPGNALSLVKNEISLKPYWLPNFKESSDNNVDTLVDQLHEKLKNSIKGCIADETNYASFLSGGLDSSTVVGVASEISPQTVQSYSIGFDAKEYDETPFARVTANHFSSKLHEYFVTPEDVVAAVPEIAAAYDEPFGNSSAVPTYYCAKKAAENGIKLMLAGDGGDELFAGNTRYAEQRYYRYYLAIPKALRKGFFDHLINALPAGLPLATKAQNYIKQADIPLPDRLQIYNFLHRHDPLEIFDKDYLVSVNTELPLAILREQFATPTQASDLNRMLYLDWLFTLADNDLRKVTTMCELAGVKVAFPLLTDEIVDFSCGIPSDLKLKGGQLRYFFRYAMKEFLPKETLSKSKHGFGLPFGVWLKDYEPLRVLAHNSLEQLKKRQYFNPAFIDKVWQMHSDGHASYYGELIWVMMMLELWLQKHTGN